jgi:hypothetical protein
MKVSHRARNGRHGRNPAPHADHRKRPAYSRRARLLKARMALLFAPRVEDFDLDRSRLGELRPTASGVHVTTLTNRAAAAETAPPTTGR